MGSRPTPFSLGRFKNESFLTLRALGSMADGIEEQCYCHKKYDSDHEKNERHATSYNGAFSLNYNGDIKENRAARGF